MKTAGKGGFCILSRSGVEILIIRLLPKLRSIADNLGYRLGELAGFYMLLIEVCNYAAMLTAVETIECVDSTDGVKDGVVRTVE